MIYLLNYLIPNTKKQKPTGTSCMSAARTYFTNEFRVSVATHLNDIAHNSDLLTSFLLSHGFPSTIWGALTYKLRECRHVSHHHCEGYWLLSWCQKPFTLLLRLGSENSKISTRFVSKEKTVLPESLEAEQRDSLGFTRLGGWLNWRRTDQKQKWSTVKGWEQKQKAHAQSRSLPFRFVSLEIWPSKLCAISVFVALVRDPETLFICKGKKGKRGNRIFAGVLSDWGLCQKAVLCQVLDLSG